MNKICFTLVVLFIALCFFQCQKETIPGTGGNNNPPPTEVITPAPITANLQGNITDENNLPVTGAGITAGTKTTVTDDKGYFRIEAASLDKNVSLVAVEKMGYFTGYRTFAATAGTNQVVIKLNKKTTAGTITAAAGGTATLANGATITLPPNSVMMASSGAAYTGDVMVYATGIDPAKDDIAQTVPGSFVGNNRDGKRIVLSSYGILAVELTSADGQKLQMKPGSVATLSSPIPSASASSAPNKLSLAYLDEPTGIWKEEATATKQGNNYVGEVAHFTDWNYDTAYNNVSATVTVKDKNGAPLVNVPVNLKAAAIGYYTQLYTDSLGMAKGFVPINETLTLELPDNCGNIVYTKTIAPVSEDADLGTITADLGSSELTVTGTLTDCNGALITNGYASIQFNNMRRYAATDSKGVFATTFTTCAGTTGSVYVSGINNATGQKSDYITIGSASPVTQTGNITVCNTQTASEYIQYTIDSTAGSTLYKFTDANHDSLMAYTSSGTTSLSGGSSLDPNFIGITVQGASAVGTYPMVTLFIGSSSVITLVQPDNVVFTSFPAQPGDYYEGTFSGTYIVSGTSVQHRISGSFKMKQF